MQNRIVFKQLLQANAIDVLQIDAIRVAGVNENIANILLAAKFGVRICAHAGGVPLENTVSCRELGFCCAIRAAAATIAKCCYRLPTG
jgi:L-alanine-DL-glutamate epimerase-like enolase superfamily enzyme